MIIKEKNSPKIFKIFKILKKEKKQNQRQNQRLWHSLRSCLFEKQRQKQKRLWLSLSLKAFLKAKAHKNRHFLGSKVEKAVFQRVKGRNLACSLVDTRSVRSSIV